MDCAQPSNIVEINNIFCVAAYVVVADSECSVGQFCSVIFVTIFTCTLKTKLPPAL